MPPGISVDVTDQQRAVTSLCNTEEPNTVSVLYTPSVLFNVNEMYAPVIWLQIPICGPDSRWYSVVAPTRKRLKGPPPYRDRQQSRCRSCFSGDSRCAPSI